ncbi:hypothetical protein ABB02_01551 [Clostridiaceae bacterium JG1575]|nr:hypothetical protein ABB02_01551 [Clostridiaceae bacterium JG1575]
MWMVLGVGALVFALMNLWRTSQHKEARGFRFLSMSLTILTLCSFYADGAARVMRGDLGGLMDTMPTLSPFLWIAALGSIGLNSCSLFRKKSELQHP